tara:strand:- start:4146 stop:4325 length:180 start_codon:yes stop_codon:yes gene_type:complete
MLHRLRVGLDSRPHELCPSISVPAIAQMKPPWMEAQQSAKVSPFLSQHADKILENENFN